MFPWLKLFVVVTAPASDEEAGVFLDHYHPQTILTNRLMANNHKQGTRDYDEHTWDQEAKYVSVIEGSADSWMGHLKKVLTPNEFMVWDDDMLFRYECWNYLDDYVNSERYGFTANKRRDSLNKLKSLLTPEAWASGWMPPPIPSYDPKLIAWLQDLWSSKTDFQGPKNVKAKISPLD